LPVVFAARRLTFAPQAVCLVGLISFFITKSQVLTRGKLMNWNVTSIVKVLNRKKFRATYGAVAKIVGCNARSVMKGLPNSYEYSWVVRGDNNLPTGYRPEDLHPDLLKIPAVVRDSKQLRRLLEQELTAG